MTPMSQPHALSRSRSETGSLLRGLDVQLHVIGALLLRELHTRYGRENIGYLWMILEPGLLATAVSAFHTGQHHGSDFAPVGFTLCGYCTFMIFRSIVGRAETTLESNQPLLFHRFVTIFDMLAARAALESVSTTATLVILWAVAYAFGLADPPARPLTLLGGIGLLTWLSLALSMSVCAATYLSKAVAKFIHPALYIVMPVSGCFFLLAWIPQPYRGWLAWVPLTQIFEMIHVGQLEAVQSPYWDPVYIVGWCLALTLAGLLSLRIVRRNVHLG
jgi:capsular polysaccharide transport system permease protein